MSDSPKYTPPKYKDTPLFKLKDRPAERQFQIINFKKQFGFIPEIIVIHKVPGKNNMMLVRAIMTEEETKNMKKREKDFQESVKKMKDQRIEVAKK